jgi:hypothetical protein
MSQASKHLTYAILVFALLFTWLFTGIVTVNRMEDEGYHELFIKKFPTFRTSFFDPYKSDPFGEEFEYNKRKDTNDDWLIGTYEMNEFLEYCKYRFGINFDDPVKARFLCKEANSVK